MKLNKILMALSAMAIVGCSSEDFDVPSATQADDSRLIQLDENFVLAGVGEVDNTMRTHWEQNAETGAFVNKFLPIYSSAPDGTSTLDQLVAGDNYETVGLCWLGQTPGAEVYTNYEFYHFGWLKKGETEADLENCDPVKLYNGAMYNEILPGTSGAAGADDEADETVFAFAVAKDFAIGDLNYNSGVYKTENKSIFGGQYIVYYPFNKDFKDAGTIPAVARTNWTAAPVDVSATVKGWMAPEIGKETFRYSAPVTIEGGNKAANFGLYNLSAIVQLRLATVASDPCIGKTIDQIVLYSASQKLLKQANLAADQIAAGATGADLYASTEGTKTIVATPTTAIGFLGTGKPDKSAYITVLPTTVDDLVAFVHRNDGKWAQISLGNTVFKAGSAKRLDINVKDADFTTDFIAVDEASLATALKNADSAVSSDPTATPTITVIGDITLTSAAFNIKYAAVTNATAGEYANIAKITITGDDIIVPEDVILTLNNNNADVNRMESNIRVLGKSCCNGTYGGRLVVEGGTIGNVTMEPTEARVTAATYDDLNPQVTYQTAPVVVAGKVDVKAGKVVVDEAVEHKGDIAIAEDAKLNVTANGDLKFVVSDDSKILNDGTIEVIGGGKFDITNISGTTTANDGKKMTNNGKFIHNVNAQVGTTVQSMKMTQNGEYRCKVANQNQLDDAYLQWTACNIIEMVNGVTKYELKNAVDANKHNDKYIDIEVTSTAPITFDNLIDSNKGDKLEIKVGNLTVTKGGLNVVFEGTSDPKNKRTLIVNGDMNVAANTNLTNSEMIYVTGNLTVEGATLTYAGNKANVKGLKVDGDITVSGATFDASAANALNITCANFYLEKGATATFGNRDASTDKNMEVTGTISNPAGCFFTISPAGTSSLYAWVTCTKLIEGGTFSAARPRVIE